MRGEFRARNLLFLALFVYDRTAVAAAGRGNRSNQTQLIVPPGGLLPLGGSSLNRGAWSVERGAWSVERGCLPFGGPSVNSSSRPTLHAPRVSAANVPTIPMYYADFRELLAGMLVAVLIAALLEHLRRWLTADC
jgi:hypothetical protein